MTKLADFEFAQRLMLGLISAVAGRDVEDIEGILETLAGEFGLAGQFGAVVGVTVE